MDMDHLMSREGMREYTDGQRDSLMDWAGEARTLAQVVTARMALTEIDGDKSAGQARRRARKVGRRMAKVAKLLTQAAAETEAVNATYVREVLELPARRKAELERKETRKQRLGIASGVEAAVAKSLTKTATAFAGQAGNPQVTPGPPPVTYTNPTPYNYTPAQAATPVGDITDHFALNLELPEAL